MQSACHQKEVIGSSDTRNINFFYGKPCSMGFTGWFFVLSTIIGAAAILWKGGWEYFIEVSGFLIKLIMIAAIKRNLTKDKFSGGIVVAFGLTV